MLALLFSTLRIVPFQIDSQFYEMTQQYTAYCPYFEEVPNGNLVPEYNFSWELSKDKKRIISVQLNGKPIYPVRKEETQDIENLFW